MENFKAALFILILTWEVANSDLPGDLLTHTTVQNTHLTPKDMASVAGIQSVMQAAWGLSLTLEKAGQSLPWFHLGFTWIHLDSPWIHLNTGLEVLPCSQYTVTGWPGCLGHENTQQSGRHGLIWVFLADIHQRHRNCWSNAKWFKLHLLLEKF